MHILDTKRGFILATEQTYTRNSKIVDNFIVAPDNHVVQIYLFHPGFTIKYCQLFSFFYCWLWKFPKPFPFMVAFGNFWNLCLFSTEIFDTLFLQQLASEISETTRYLEVLRTIFFFFWIFHKCLWTDFNKILIFLNGKIALRQKLMLVSAISADLSGIEFASFIKMIESEKAHFTAIENRLIFIF